ncbi:lipoprotein [Klebsiella sp. GB_Kp060]|uniref:lipoprotein n=1 Tax=Klebsiella TaxID=570 RepID=UPI00115D10D2|nr:lipoprotein [Klebsiella quasipneumoniae]HDH1380079.1 lipoprotein [Klebsiella quasipneumoniae subsp. similipneumoniae]HDU4850525.1 lipoprotein [Klebsiella quasipneumoniae subsp. similipneumoniae]
MFPIAIKGNMEMRKILVVALGVVLLSGCTMMDKSRDPKLNGVQGVALENNGTYEFLKSYQKSLSGKLNEGKIKVCIVRSISNDDVILDGSSSVTNSSFTSSVYVKNQVVASGGSVVNEAASSENSAVANGTTSYYFDVMGMPIERVVKFTLDIDGSGSGIKYTFTNIKQAQKDTGTLTNSGFSPIGSWAGAGPYQTIQALDKIVTDINSCASS